MLLWLSVGTMNSGVRDRRDGQGDYISSYKTLIWRGRHGSKGRQNGEWIPGAVLLGNYAEVVREATHLVLTEDPNCQGDGIDRPNEDTRWTVWAVHFLGLIP